MYTKIKLIKEIYKIDENDGEAKKEALEKIKPYMDQIMDAFYEKLLQKEEFAQFIDRDKIPELKQKQIKFIVQLLSKPFDENMYKQIAKVGVVHYHIRLDPIYMSYGYHLLSELILQQSKKDPALLPYLKLVIKYLKVSDAIMSNEYFSQKTLIESPYRANNLFFAINELHLAFIRYKNAMNDFEVSQAEVEQFQKSLDNLNECREILSEVGIELSTLKRFHTEFLHNKDEKSFANLQNALEKPFNDLTVTAYLSTGSSLSVLRAMTATIHEKMIVKQENFSLKEVKENIFKILTQNFAWAINEIEFVDGEIEREYEIVKHLMFKGKVFFLCIDLKNISNKLYIAEMVDLLCETIKVTLYLHSKES